MVSPVHPVNSLEDFISEKRNVALLKKSVPGFFICDLETDR